MTRITRDELGLRMALLWAERSTCARRKVGCALFDADGYMLSAGYNGPASSQPHCTDSPCPGAGMASGTGLEACEALHAEWNAIARCSDVRKIHACFVTASPCMTCTKMLLNTSCRRIVFVERYAHDAPAEALWTRQPVAMEEMAYPPVGHSKFKAVYRTWEQGMADA